MKISTNGIQINIEDRGSGEPVLVFLHYWGGSARTWSDVIDRLNDRHRSIALDHRGWGHSDAPDHGYDLSDLADDAQGVIRALKLTRYLVVGSLTVPALVLSGEHDQVDPTSRLREELLPCIADGRLQVLSRVGHLSMLEKPEAVAQAIEEFISHL